MWLIDKLVKKLMADFTGPIALLRAEADRLEDYVEELEERHFSVIQAGKKAQAEVDAAIEEREQLLESIRLLTSPPEQIIGAIPTNDGTLYIPTHEGPITEPVASPAGPMAFTKRS